MPGAELPALPVRAFLLGRRVRLLVAVTMAHTAVAAALSWAAGTGLTGPGVAGVGVHLLVSLTAALPVWWQFAGDPVARERRAVRAMAVSFAGLCAYSAVDAVRDAIEPPLPGESWAGAALALLVAAAFVALGVRERRDPVELAAEDPGVAMLPVVVAVASGLLTVAVIDLQAGTTVAGPAVATAVAVLSAREAIHAQARTSRPGR